MTMTFPDLSHSFDTTQRCVRFSGYDYTREVPFFIDESALPHVDGGILPNPQSLVMAFDRNRDRICKAAGKAYGHLSEGSYTLTISDF